MGFFEGLAEQVAKARAIIDGVSPERLRSRMWERTQIADKFRAVHDYFGHIKDGNGFRAGGEENAWRSHAAMYSPLARRAMTTETRGGTTYSPRARRSDSRGSGVWVARRRSDCTSRASSPENPISTTASRSPSTSSADHRA